MTAMLSADVIEEQFVEHEHRRLRAGLGTLQDTIEAAHRIGRSALSDGVVRTLAWVRRDVYPHAAWEEAWLYPHLDQTAGTPWATRALRFEHEQIREVAAVLEAEHQVARDRWTPELTSRLTVALTRLETLVSAHLAQEERFVIPMLELGPERAADENGGRS